MPSRWEFYTDDSDIAYAVYIKKGSDLVPVVPTERVDSHITNEEGELHCDGAGTCWHLKFNSFPNSLQSLMHTFLNRCAGI